MKHDQKLPDLLQRGAVAPKHFDPRSGQCLVLILGEG